MTAQSTQPAQARTDGTLITAAFCLGASMLLSSGVLHLYLWGDDDLRYRDVDIIGVLFLLQGIVGCVLAVITLAWRGLLMALVGTAYMAGSMAGLIKSINGGLFGNGETLDAPHVKTALGIEVIGLAAFGTALILLIARARRNGDTLSLW